MKKCLAILAAVVLAGALFAGCAKSASSIPSGAVDAMKDAAACADELSLRYEGFRDSAQGTAQAQTSETRTYDVASAQINGDIDRVQADIDAIEAAGGSWEGRDQAIAAMKNLQGALHYELDILEAQNLAYGSLESGQGVSAAMAGISALYDEYSAITPPDCLKDYLANTIDVMPTVYSALVYNASAPNSTLSQYTSQELLTWWFTKQSAYDAEENNIIAKQCQASSDLLNALASGASPSSEPSVSVDMIDTIAPNLYPSLDSVANIAITAYDQNQSAQIEVELVGFSQKYEQKLDLAQGFNYLPVKPALLPVKELPNLASNMTTQLNVKVTDSANGTVLAQESHEVSLLSMYDFTWSNDEFGATAAFDILAWLRPQADEVNAVNRAAADVLGSWTGGKYQSIAGYQYGDDIFATLLQVMAIQKAISDKGVTYVVDSYSFASDQHVLTPDAVVQKKQGLCIETALLMSSCLMSAGMHPLIIITPGHAQVAVESYAGSGAFFLIETTTLPYSGFKADADYTDPAFYNGLLASARTDSGSIHYWTTSGSSEEWKEYFNYTANGSDEFGGNFVIDCNLQSVMEIQGLENM